MCKLDNKETFSPYEISYRLRYSLQVRYQSEEDCFCSSLIRFLFLLLWFQLKNFLIYQKSLRTVELKLTTKFYRIGLEVNPGGVCIGTTLKWALCHPRDHIGFLSLSFFIISVSVKTCLQHLLYEWNYLELLRDTWI